jgi:tetratricopeptide (TPR) repeat protein
MPRCIQWALAVSLLAMTVGCSQHRIRIERTRPARFSLGANQPVALQVEKDGTPTTSHTVFEAVVDVSQGQMLNKWLAVDPVRTELNAQMRGAGYTVVDGAAASLILRVRPTSWSYQLEKWSDLRSGHGRLQALIEIVDARDPNARPVFTETYWATAGADDEGEPEAMVRAARNLVQAFIEELRPYRVWDEVELDDDDPRVKPGIALCERGQFEEAYAVFSDAVASNPRSAPALYNLGLLAESRGSYDEAESVLMRAIEIAPKTMYYSAIERVRLARRDAEALRQ